MRMMILTAMFAVFAFNCVGMATKSVELAAAQTGDAVVMLASR